MAEFMMLPFSVPHRGVIGGTPTASHARKHTPQVDRYRLP